MFVYSMQQLLSQRMCFSPPKVVKDYILLAHSSVSSIDQYDRWVDQHNQ